MTLPVILLPSASLDISHAIFYYEEVRAGYGERFRLELDRTIGIISHWPEAYERITDRLRKATIRHFSDAIIYRHFPEFIRIVGVVSTHRDPALMGSFDRF